MFEDIFSHILEQAVKAGVVTEANFYIDSTHIKVNANKHWFTNKMTYGPTNAYQNELENQINKERITAGKCPFTWNPESELSLQKISHSAPESSGLCYLL